MNPLSSIPPFEIPSRDEVIRAAGSIPTLGALKECRGVVAQARKTVKSYMVACNRAILDFKYALNELTPAGQLPVDILSHIMVLVSQSVYQNCKDNEADDKDSEYGDDKDDDELLFVPPHAWITVGQVCRSWRAVALATPAFWANIYRPDYTSLDVLLSRSQQAPLCISLPSVESTWRARISADAFTPLVESICNEAHRLRQIDLLCCPSDIEKFCAALDCSANQLQKLVMYGTPRSTTEMMSENPVERTANILPCLRYLKVHHLLISWRSKLFSSALHTLIYNPKSFFCGGETRRLLLGRLGSFDEFMSALESLAPTLEVLQLRDCIPPLELEYSFPRVSTQAISFTRLRECVIAAGTKECVYFFRRMSLPRLACKIYLKLDDDSPGLEELMSHLGGYFSHREAPPLSIVRLECDDMRTMSLRAWIDEPESTERGDADLRLRNLRPSGGRDLDLTPVFPLESLSMLCENAFASLRALILHCEFRAVDIHWSTVLAWLPELRVLHVCGMALRTDSDDLDLEGLYTLNDLHDALMCSRDAHTGEPITPCPCLETLKLEFMDGVAYSGGTALASELRTCLESRSDAGVPLAKLFIEGFFYDVKRTHVAELQPWAGEVQWVYKIRDVGGRRGSTRVKTY